ncbi:MAG: hypothetical protein NC930_05680 [Candidatus Omnitrophica bacterium]|nr:hypothetical protein [Candidatus Omnitrophota bacterium]
MDRKRVWIASLAVFVVIFVAELVLHGIWLKELYEQTSTVWRPMSEMQGMMWIMWVSYFFVSLVFVLIYTKGLESGKSGLGQGLRYGFLIGFFMAIPAAFISYVILPIPYVLAVGWFVGTMIEFVLAGMVAGLIYPPLKK